jgi:hypothetical protein
MKKKAISKRNRGGFDQVDQHHRFMLFNTRIGNLKTIKSMHHPLLIIDSDAYIIENRELNSNRE